VSPLAGEADELGIVLLVSIEGSAIPLGYGAAWGRFSRGGLGQRRSTEEGL